MWVLLHELGHIDQQHGMRALGQNSMGLAAAADQLTQFHYSRDFEREADQQKTGGYWNSHPSSQEQIEMIRAHLPK